MHTAEWHLPTRHIGRRTLFFERIDSTNTHAMTLADDSANDGLVLLAAEQTAGRGQHGRTWLSPPGSSVLLSVLLFPEGPLRQPAVLTAWAAVSVCHLIEEITGQQSRIKWPNDVLLAERKTCGILIEQQVRRGRLAAAAGIGLNVNQQQRDFERAELPVATSLAAASGQTFDAEAVAKKFIAVLDREYEAVRAGDTASLESAWRQRLGLLGQIVVVEAAHENVLGRLVNASFEHIEIETPAGESRHFRPETVRHLHRP